VTPSEAGEQLSEYEQVKLAIEQTRVLEEHTKMVVQITPYCRNKNAFDLSLSD